MKSAHLTFTLTGRYRLPFLWLLPFVYLNFTVLTLTGRNVAIVVVCVVFITYFCLFLPVQDECDGLCGDLCRLYLTCTFSYLYRTVAVTIVVVCAVCVSYLFLSLSSQNGSSDHCDDLCSFSVLSLPLLPLQDSGGDHCGGLCRLYLTFTFLTFTGRWR